MSAHFRAEHTFPASCPTATVDEWVEKNANAYDFIKHGWPAWFPTRTLAEWEKVREVQVVDRDSRMQGIHGVSAIFNRIDPRENAGKVGDPWQSYDITLVDRHVTVVLNGKKVIDNHPLAGCTNGALQADETIPGAL